MGYENDYINIQRRYYSALYTFQIVWNWKMKIFFILYSSRKLLFLPRKIIFVEKVIVNFSDLVEILWKYIMARCIIDIKQWWGINDAAWKDFAFTACTQYLKAIKVRPPQFGVGEWPTKPFVVHSPTHVMFINLDVTYKIHIIVSYTG